MERGEIKRLAIFLPPGSAKSTYSSVQFPPHFLARRSNIAVLACSHSTELAESFGRRCRNLIESHELELGYTLCEHSRSAGRWETSNGGNYFCAGVGTAIAGYRADLGLIDDPLRNKEDADSKLIRDKHWDWYNFDFKPRLKPDASVVLIQTRWHEDDLAGRILANEGKDWTVVRIPFFAEENDPMGRAPGDMLWPEWFTKSMFPTDSRVANALYQNNPTPEEGDFFKADWLVEYRPEQLPQNLLSYCASDHAVSTKEEADRTLLVNFGVDSGDNIWIKPDFFWDRADTSVVVEQMLNMAERDKPLWWFAGKEHITSSIGPFLRKRMAERGVYITMQETTSRRDKQTRCQAIRGRMSNRKVFFPAFHPKWHDVKHEILSFPAGTHDEWPDVLGEIGRGLDSMVKGGVEESVTDDIDSLINRAFVPTLSWLKTLENDRKMRETARYNGR